MATRKASASKPVTHAIGHPDGIALCDALCSGISSRLGRKVMPEVTTYCGLSLPGQSQFATLNHRKTLPSLNVFVRLPYSDRPDLSSLELRNRVGKKAWRACEIDFYLSRQDQVEDACSLLMLAAIHVENSRPVQERMYFGELPEPPLYEGAVQRVLVNAYERNPKARAKCIKHYGAVCQVCTFDFGKEYGPVGSGLIHVHHLRPLHTTNERYRVNPIKDLIPVCPNCHAIIHLRSEPEPYTPEEVRAMLLATKHLSTSD